jgi:four helix bundle protein
MEGKDLAERLFEFAVAVLLFVKTLPKNPENGIIRYQLVKSSSSAAANYEESQAGSSRPDFTNKIRISLREMRESNFWLRLLQRTESEIDKEKNKKLIKESSELMKILGSIASKCRT